MKTAIYRYWEFTSLSDAQSKGNGNPIKTICPVIENKHFYGDRIFLQNVTYGYLKLSATENTWFWEYRKKIFASIQEKSVYLLYSECPRNSVFMESLNKFLELINIFQRPIAKKVIVTGLTTKNFVPIPTSA